MWIWRYYYTKKNWNIKKWKNWKKRSRTWKNHLFQTKIWEQPCHASLVHTHVILLRKPMNRDIHLERPFGQQNISPTLLPRKRICPLKMDGSKMKFLLKWSIFRDLFLFRRVYPWIMMYSTFPPATSTTSPRPEIPLPLMESWTSQRTWPIHFRAIPWEKTSHQIKQHSKKIATHP